MSKDEEARTKVDQHKQERQKVTPAMAGTSQCKRGSEHTSPNEAPQLKQRKTKPSTTTSAAAGKVKQATRYATVAKITKVGILPDEWR